MKHFHCSVNTVAVSLVLALWCLMCVIKGRIECEMLYVTRKAKQLIMWSHLLDLYMYNCHLWLENQKQP
jgi:hypothetical protein